MLLSDKINELRKKYNITVISVPLAEQNGTVFLQFGRLKFPLLPQEEYFTIETPAGDAGITLKDTEDYEFIEGPFGKAVLKVGKITIYLEERG